MNTDKFTITNIRQGGCGTIADIVNTEGKIIRFAKFLEAAESDCRLLNYCVENNLGSKEYFDLRSKL